MPYWAHKKINHLQKLYDVSGFFVPQNVPHNCRRKVRFFLLIEKMIQVFY